MDVSLGAIKKGPYAGDVSALALLSWPEETPHKRSENGVSDEVAASVEPEKRTLPTLLVGKRSHTPSWGTAAERDDQSFRRTCTPSLHLLSAPSIVLDFNIDSAGFQFLLLLHSTLLLCTTLIEQCCHCSLPDLLGQLVPSFPHRLE